MVTFIAMDLVVVATAVVTGTIITLFVVIPLIQYWKEMKALKKVGKVINEKGENKKCT